MWYFEKAKSIQVLSNLQKPFKGCSFDSCCLFTLKRNNQGTRWHIRDIDIQAGDIDNDCSKCNKVYKDGERIVALSCMYPVF